MSPTLKSVLVTGANGFVGKAVTASLERDGWDVIRTARSTGDCRGMKIDFESPSFFSDLCAVPRVDAIVHLATRVGFGSNSLQELFLANVAATAALVAMAKHMNAHFVFASAALVAGASACHIGRATADNPDSPYMSSKLLAEHVIQASGVKAAILRIGGVFGLNGPNHLGINRAIQSVLEGNPPIVSGDGRVLRNYIYVKDVAAIISDVLRRDISGTHLVAGSESLSVDDMLKSLCEVFLPGAEALHREGRSVSDQLVDPSPDLLRARAFRAALKDMRTEVNR